MGCAMTRPAQSLAVVLAALLILPGCSGGGSSDGDVITNPKPPVGSLVTLTIKTDIPATNTSGDIWVRWGERAFTRAEFTYQDYKCAAGDGPKTCTFQVPKGQVITVASNDNQAGVQIGAIQFNQQNIDPRQRRSQFSGMEGTCAQSSPQAMCVLTGNADQTLLVKYKPLYWTRVNFVGSNEWKIKIVAPPTYGIADLLQIGAQTRVATPGNNFLNGEVPQCYQTALTPTHCFSIVTAEETSITFEALPPPGPQPKDSPGPMNLVSYDNGCSVSTPLCALKKNTDQTLTVKWEYYVCAAPNFTVNPGWKLTPIENKNGECTLRQP